MKTLSAKYTSRTTLPWAFLSFCRSLPPHAWASQLSRQSNHRANRGVTCARHQNWLLLPAGNWKGVQQLPEEMALLKSLLGLQGFGQKCSISSSQGEQFWKDKGHLKSSGWVSSWKKTQCQCLVLSYPVPLHPYLPKLQNPLLPKSGFISSPTSPTTRSPLSSYSQRRVLCSPADLNSSLPLWAKNHSEQWHFKLCREGR